MTASELGERLLALLAAIDSGEMNASAATRYRIEGAVVALDALSGMSVDDIIRRLDVESDDPGDVARHGLS